TCSNVAPAIPAASGIGRDGPGVRGQGGPPHPRAVWRTAPPLSSPLAFTDGSLLSAAATRRVRPRNLLDPTFRRDRFPRRRAHATLIAPMRQSSRRLVRL